jgi:hypothetical protein
MEIPQDPERPPESAWGARAVHAVVFLVVASLAALLATVCASDERDDDLAGPTAALAHLNVGELADLRAILPQRGTIGFQSDQDGGRSPEKDFIQAQFDLAPLVLVRSADHPFVLAHYSDREAGLAFGAQHGLELRRDLGEGFLLFAKSAK